MPPFLSEDDENPVGIYYHFKLIMRPENPIDDVGVVKPNFFCNGYTLMELEACEHHTTDCTCNNNTTNTNNNNNNYITKDNRGESHADRLKSIESKLCLRVDNRAASRSLGTCPDSDSTETLTSDRSNESEEKCASQPRYRNTHLSVADAISIMRNNTKHLGVLFASTSFVRLRLQGRPIDLPAEKKFTGSHGLANATERALRQAERLHDELKFLHEYALKSEECDKIVPADVIVERKGRDPATPSKVSTIIVVSVLVIVVVRNYFVRLPSLSIEF